MDRLIGIGQLTSTRKGEGLTAIIDEVMDNPTVVYRILRRSKPVAVLMSVAEYERLTDCIEGGTLHDEPEGAPI